MKRRCPGIRLVLLCAVPWLCASAWAQTAEESREAAARGQFMEAAQIGLDSGTSEGYVAAAEALAIHGYYIAGEPEEKRAIFRRAMDAAERAIASGPDNPEAHFQSAHVMGRYARMIGSVEALSEGFAGRIRAALDTALALAPDHPHVHLGLAGWHAGIVVAVGFMANFLYGATEEDALAHYERALELAPDESVVLYEYAVNLLDLDSDYEAKARGLLVRAATLPVTDAYGEIVNEQVRVALDALGDDDG